MYAAMNDQLGVRERNLEAREKDEMRPCLFDAFFRPEMTCKQKNSLYLLKLSNEESLSLGTRKMMTQVELTVLRCMNDTSFWAYLGLGKPE